MLHNSKPLRRDASSECNLKVAVRTSESIDPKFQVLPKLLSELSYLECLLLKKARVQSNADYSDYVSSNLTTETLEALAILIDKSSSNVDNYIKCLYPNSNTTFFLFKSNISNLFPLASRVFNVPDDPFVKANDLYNHLKNMSILLQLLDLSKLLITKLKTPNANISDNLIMLSQSITSIGGGFQKFKLEMAEKFDLLLNAGDALSMDIRLKKWFLCFLNRLLNYIATDQYFVPESLEDIFTTD